MAALVLLVAASSTAAQDDAGPRSTTTTRVERAPDGSMRRGWLDVPSWLVLTGGALIALGAAGGLAYRIGTRR